MSSPTAQETVEAVRQFIKLMRCDCYHPDLMEYALTPCDKCNLDQLVNGGDDDE